MRLVDLHPEWQHHWDDIASDPAAWLKRSRKATGVSFDCPVHGTAHRVYVDFANPFDGVKPRVRNHLWARTGETFDTLTLSPSVDYTKYDNGTMRDPTCWHGFLQNGEIT